MVGVTHKTTTSWRQGPRTCKTKESATSVTNSQGGDSRTLRGLGAHLLGGGPSTRCSGTLAQVWGLRLQGAVRQLFSRLGLLQHASVEGGVIADI